jgi:lycopene cyclase domain-containing protein
MAGCFLITLPLELVGARVYRNPKRLLFVLGIPFVFFTIWDAVAIARDHWSFNSAYVTGWVVIAGIPIEEIVFFVVVPCCALLTYETVRRLLPMVQRRA